MLYVNAILFGLTLVIFVLLGIKGRSHAKKQDAIKRKFFEEEDAANAVRKKEIDPALYYEPDLGALPPVIDSDPHQVSRCAKRKMIRFDAPISNLELKKQYGLAQMDILAQYEENFSEYLKALTAWGAEIAADNPADAKTILNTAIGLGSEFRDTYKIAADLCGGDVSALEKLLEIAESNHFKDPNVKSHVLEYIRGLL